MKTAQCRKKGLKNSPMEQERKMRIPDRYQRRWAMR
ncbi:unnamed protein product, partial [Larinioides sclopetarius]